MRSPKQIAIDVIQSLPDDCTLEDISYRLYVHRKLEQSAADIEQGRTHTQQPSRRNGARLVLTA
jgi:hypothetical protein